jgi:hypothetical protein
MCVGMYVFQNKSFCVSKETNSVEVRLLFEHKTNRIMKKKIWTDTLKKILTSFQRFMRKEL